MVLIASSGRCHNYTIWLQRASFSIDCMVFIVRFNSIFAQFMIVKTTTIAHLTPMRATLHVNQVYYSQFNIILCGNHNKLQLL